MLTFYEWIKENNKLPSNIIYQVNAYATEKAIPFSDALTESGAIEEEEFLTKLAEYNNTSFLQAPEILKNIDESIIDLINPEKAKEYNFMPYTLVNDVLKIIVCTETSRPAENYASSAILCNYVIPVYTTKTELDALIDKYYTKADVSDAEELTMGEEEDVSNFNVVDLDKSDSKIERIINEMIKVAIENAISDIHIAPEEYGVSIRFRKDGILSEYTSFKSKSLLSRLVNKIKTSANMKIEETRKTQSGHYSASYKNNTVNFRVSTLPTIHGIEKVTLRLLNQQALNLSIENMKFSNEIKTQFLRLIKKPQGIILITGPTGSGKTTTLYTALATIANPEINIVTLEDPAEYQLGMNIVQSQINHNIGMDFAAMLREVLRQDPDVILIGEIRDYETAEIAVQAANTGHLVFSTLHTNDSISAITRLVEMGIKTYNVADSLLAVMAQRLVRRVCPSCKVPHKYVLTEEDKFMLKTEDDSFDGYVPHATGCPVCKYSGYQGRLPIHELLILDENIRDLLAENKNSVEIKKYVKTTNMKFLADDAYAKAKNGETTLEEIRRVIG